MRALTADFIAQARTAAQALRRTVNCALLGALRACLAVDGADHRAMARGAR